MKKRGLMLLFSASMCLLSCGKDNTSNDEKISSSIESQTESSSETSTTESSSETSTTELVSSEVVSSSEDISSEEIKVIDTSYREDRNFSPYKLPSNVVNEALLPAASSDVVFNIDDSSYSLLSSSFRLDFIKNDEGKYSIYIFEVSENHQKQRIDISSSMVQNVLPVHVFIQGGGDEINVAYDSIITKEFGYLATATFTTTNGSKITVEDRYYFPKENEDGVFNVNQCVRVDEASSNDKGFASSYHVNQQNAKTTQWFVPNLEFKKTTSNGNYRETIMGLPMAMFRDIATGNTVSLSRYQPIVNYEDNSYASINTSSNKKQITIDYPAVDGNRKFHTLETGKQHVYDLSIRVDKTEDYEQASIDTYNAHFNLQNQRIVNTDIDEVYKVICEDYKTFLHVTDQEEEKTGRKYKSYGLPWRITIEDGEFGPLTYQAGFIGQQIPSAYNMMLYGLRNNDLTSLQNGINVIDFWVDSAEMMSVAGVPHIWYDTWDDGFRAYPCFLRMAVDAMEGMLDAYRLAIAHGIYKENWETALEMFSDFLVNNQNEDGSYYRCYNYDGGPFVSWDNGIEEPPGNICQSTSKSCSAMPIRFLTKMYEMTGDEDYKDAALLAGEFVYNNLYPQGYYAGGTCDGPNQVDKEAGVFAMYAFDSLYQLTKDEKWIKPLEQATAYTMSTAICFSYNVKESNLKTAYPLYAGYTDGMSFIACSSGSGADNYIAYIYYELFRVYIITGKETYLKQAEFIQQNTKSIMNWDGTLGYKYKSLVPEASSISSFKYSSASNGAWVTWSSVANAEPIAKMYANFGHADVAYYKDMDINELRSMLDNIGAGGKTHIIYENTIVDKIS